MAELFRCSGAVEPKDSKTVHSCAFEVPPGVSELHITFDYDPGQITGHTLMVLALRDPNGFRGAGHRFATHQAIRLGSKSATPGFIAGPLPPGLWTVEISMFWVASAAEVRPCAYSLVVEVPRAARRVHAEPTALQPNGRWYKGDLHSHTNHSDGSWTAAELAEAARNYDLDFIALTDHNTMTGLPEIRAAAGNDLLIIPGMELTTFNGHAVALGLEKWIDWQTGHNGRTINTVATEVREAGGLFILVHPDAERDEICTGCRWVYPDFDLKLAHAVQVWGGYSWDSPEERNYGCLQLWREWLNEGYNLSAVGGTDTHGPDGWRDNSGWTYVWAEELSVDAILAGLRAGHTYVSNGPALNIEARDADGVHAGVGEVLSTHARPTIRASWSDCPEAQLRIMGDGHVQHLEQVVGRGELDLPVEHADSWFCAELWNAKEDMLLAITSSVHIRYK